MARDLAQTGITTAKQLRETGAHEAYGAMMRAGVRPHFIGYYVLVMSLHGRPWNDCKAHEKAELRKKFDSLKTTHFDKDRSAFEAELDAIGVIKRPKS